MALGAPPARSSRIIRPAFAQAVVFTKLSTRATISPSPTRGWDTNWNWSLMSQMSTPAPVSEKMPDVQPALPATAGLPTSCDVQGAGSAGSVTGKATALMARPPTGTTRVPVVAPAGTGTTILVAAHVVGVPVVPLKVTVLVPLVVPKLVPVIVTDVPAGPTVGDRLVMLAVVERGTS